MLRVKKVVAAVMFALYVGSLAAADAPVKTQTIELIKPPVGWVAELQAFPWPLEPGQAPPLTLESDGKDRSIPRPVFFDWKPPFPRLKDVVYELDLSTNADLSNPVIRKQDIEEPYCEVVNLCIGTEYYWQVTARDFGGDAVLAGSPVWSFTTDATPPRWMLVPGVTNVRDIGGWILPDNKHRIRQGCIYRSGQLVYRSGESDTRRRITWEGSEVLLNDLKIRTDLDLRGVYDRREAGPVFDESVVKWIHVPIIPYGGIMDEGQQAQFRKVFEVFADAKNCPILFHCAAGADRAGTVAFLLHGLLGMSMEDSLRDYEMTTLSQSGVRSRKRADVQAMLAELRSLVSPDERDDLAAQAEAYVRRIGITDEEIATIRRILIEEIPSSAPTH